MDAGVSRGCLWVCVAPGRRGRSGGGNCTDYHVDKNNHTGYAQVLEEMQGDVVLEAVLAGQIRHLLKDGHGSTRQLVDTTGAVINSGTAQVFAYDAYGVPVGFTLANALTALLYSRELTDQLTGLQYLRARYYNPATGTFNRLDPFAGNFSDPQSLHKYLYCHADAVNMVDPSGLFTLGGLSVGMSIVLTMSATTAVQGGLILLTLSTVGDVGSKLRAAGLAMMAEGNLDAGLPLYNAGNRILGVALFTAEVAAGAIDAFGASVTLFGLVRAMSGFVRTLPTAIRELPEIVKLLKSGKVPQLIKSLARDYWAHGGGMSWDDAKTIVKKFGFEFDSASNLKGTRFDNRRGAVLIAQQDTQGGQVNKIMLAEEIQHGLDKATNEAGRFARRNPGLKGQELLDKFHVEHFERILDNAASGKFDFLDSDDIAGIQEMITLLKGGA